MTHAKLKKQKAGQFGAIEWALTGAPCSVIESLAQKIIRALPQYRFAYVDAAHNADPGETPEAFCTYTDKTNFRQINYRAPLNEWQLRPLLRKAQAVLINGNHFKGLRQIVIIDSRKEASLQRKLDRLTDVQMVLLADRESPYEFLAEKINNVPVLSIQDIEAIAGILAGEIEQNTPELYGLVLAGGRSRRMGEDKSLIDYHGKPQREYVADLLSRFTSKTFISGREDQVPQEGDAFEWLTDTFTDLGPYGGILSAFRAHPDKAWLVMATDIPLMNEDGLKLLVENRDPAKIATAFLNESTGFPEPLISIWEPRAYQELLLFLAQAVTCPRKVLINSDIQLVNLPDQSLLANVNTPEERRNLNLNAGK